MHLKRKMVPKFWPIHRKEFCWAVKPRPGPHKFKESLPLTVILREILGVAKTRRETNVILTYGNIKVDGVIRRDNNFPVGIMDVVEIPVLKKAYRMLPIPSKGLMLHSIGFDEKDYKICKIQGKTNVKEGHVQLNLHDGVNILIKVADYRHPVEDIYKTYDSLKVKIPSFDIMEHLRFEPGVLALVARGRNAGKWGKVVKVSEPNIYGSTVTLKGDEGGELETPLEYIFPIGKEKMWINLPGVTKV